MLRDTDAPDTCVRCVHSESSVICVRNSDSVRDRVKVSIASMALVTARVRFRDNTRHRCTRCRRTHQRHFTHTLVPDRCNSICVRWQAIFSEVVCKVGYKIKSQLRPTWNILCQNYVLSSNTSSSIDSFYLRDAMLARSLWQRRVRTSVRLSHAGIVPSTAKAGSWNVHRLIAPCF